jgi:hypothetical protein
MDLSENDTLIDCFKIRTITAFISDSIVPNPELLSLQIEPVAKFLRETQSIYEAKGTL